MEKNKLNRINELAHIAKERDLTPEELAERKLLRDEYLAEIRYSLTSQLDGAYIKEADGSLTPLKKQ